MDISTTLQTLQGLINTTSSQATGYAAQTAALTLAMTTLNNLNTALAQANATIAQLGGQPVVIQTL